MQQFWRGKVVCFWSDRMTASRAEEPKGVSVQDIEREIRSNKEARSAVVRVLVTEFTKELTPHLDIVKK
jgi:hypothetical protein